VSSEEAREQTLREWYYEQVGELGLVRTDVELIWRTKKGVTRCYTVDLPDGLTREELKEYLDILKREMEKDRGEGLI